MLMAAKLPLPKKIFAYGWWTNEGQKISKSIGNVIDPNEMIKKYGLDQLRFFLLREVTLGQDGDFSEQSFKTRINSDLSNNLGNLIQRALKFNNKNFSNKMPFELEKPNKDDLLFEVYNMYEKIKPDMDNYQISKAIEKIFTLLNKLNKFMDKSEPWNSFKTNQELAARDLSILIESFRVIGIILKPYIPDASEKILGFLNVKDENRDFKFIDFKYKLKKGHCINDPEPLFPRYE